MNLIIYRPALPPDMHRTYNTLTVQHRMLVTLVNDNFFCVYPSSCIGHMHYRTPVLSCVSVQCVTLTSESDMPRSQASDWTLVNDILRV